MLKITKKQLGVIAAPIPMNKMQPLQVGQIEDPESLFDKEFVLCCPGGKGVISLSTPSATGWWSQGSRLLVRVLREGEKITVDFFNP